MNDGTRYAALFGGDPELFKSVRYEVNRRGLEVTHFIRDYRKALESVPFMHPERTALAIVGEFSVGEEAPSELVKVIHAFLPGLPVIAVVATRIPATEYIHPKDEPLLQLTSVLHQLAVAWK